MSDINWFRDINKTIKDKMNIFSQENRNHKCFSNWGDYFVQMYSWDNSFNKDSYILEKILTSSKNSNKALHFPNCYSYLRLSQLKCPIIQTVDFSENAMLEIFWNKCEEIISDKQSNRSALEELEQRYNFELSDIYKSNNPGSNGSGLFEGRAFYDIEYDEIINKRAVTTLGNVFKHIFPRNIEESKEIELLKNFLEDILSEIYKKSEAYSGLNTKWIEDYKKGYDNCCDSIFNLYTLLTAILICAQSNKYIAPEFTGIKKRKPADKTLLAPNIYIASKGTIEEKYSLADRCAGAKRILIINYASTSFLLSSQVSKDAYDPSWKEFFYNEILPGKTEIAIVLTWPTTYAEDDAIEFKMKPKSLNVDASKIIVGNIKRLLEIITDPAFKDCNIHFYLTRVALPCGYLQCDFAAPEKNNIKVDIYLPNFENYEDSGCLKNQQNSDAEIRQSFVLYNEGITKEPYKNFCKNANAILKASTKIDLKEIAPDIKEDDLLKDLNRRLQKTLRNT